MTPASLSGLYGPQALGGILPTFRCPVSRLADRLHDVPPNVRGEL